MSNLRINEQATLFFQVFDDIFISSFDMLTNEVPHFRSEATLVINRVRRQPTCCNDACG